MGRKESNQTNKSNMSNKHNDFYKKNSEIWPRLKVYHGQLKMNILPNIKGSKEVCKLSFKVIR